MENTGGKILEAARRDGYEDTETNTVNVDLYVAEQIENAGSVLGGAKRIGVFKNSVVMFAANRGWTVKQRMVAEVFDRQGNRVIPAERLRKRAKVQS